MSKRMKYLNATVGIALTMSDGETEEAATERLSDALQKVKDSGEIDYFIIDYTDVDEA